jgi:6-pyruvoyltetrahydropterin/6-carboxytetrahydropterin synthase
MKSVLDMLDHKDLNELPYFKGESPSSEMISMFIYNQLKERIGLVSKVSVWETPTSCASYYEE